LLLQHRIDELKEEVGPVRCIRQMPFLASVAPPSDCITCPEYSVLEQLPHLLIKNNIFTATSQKQGDQLRQLIDDRFIAASILLLSGSEVDTQVLKNSTEVCRNYYAEAVSEQEVWSSKEEMPSPKRLGRGGDKATIEEKEVRR
jgi:hypothetical protein